MPGRDGGAPTHPHIHRVGAARAKQGRRPREVPRDGRGRAGAQRAEARQRPILGLGVPNGRRAGPHRRGGFLVGQRLKQGGQGQVGLGRLQEQEARAVARAAPLLAHWPGHWRAGRGVHTPHRVRPAVRSRSHGHHRSVARQAQEVVPVQGAGAGQDAVTPAIRAGADPATCAL